MTDNAYIAIGCLAVIVVGSVMPSPLTTALVIVLAACGLLNLWAAIDRRRHP